MEPGEPSGAMHGSNNSRHGTGCLRVSALELPPALQDRICTAAQHQRAGSGPGTVPGSGATGQVSGSPPRHAPQQWGPQGKR